MALIEFENKPSTKTPINKDNLNHNFKELDNAVNEKNIITGLLGSLTITTTSDSVTTDLPLSQYNKIGSKLSIENGKIKIGAGVNYVKVSLTGTVYAEDGQTYQRLYISKNNGNNFAVSCRHTPSWMYTMSIQPVLMAVTEGDLIFPKEFNRLAGTTICENIYMTVEVVK